MPLLVGILGFVAIAIIAWNLDAPVSVGSDVGNVIFRVTSGETVSEIATRLESDGLIKSSLFFRLLAKMKGVESGLQKGSYSLSPAVKSSDILQILTSGKQILVRVTVPEGATMRMIAEILEREGIVGGSAFLDVCASPEVLAEYGIPATTLEGYLYPETYMFPLEYDPAKVARTMVDGFFNAVNSVIANTMPSVELHRKVILASIVEREYRAPEEAGLIAGVFENRLKIGMKLQSCATVVYAMTERLGLPHPDRLLFTDIEIDDPYNTYLIKGLPPAPIANPGMIAIRAALFPTQSEYLYFVLMDESTGRHFFSSTYDAHLSAKSLSPKKR
jgi:UPF0755 protein